MPLNREHAMGGAGVFQHPRQRLRTWRTTLFRNPVLGLKLIVSHYLNPARLRVAQAWRQFERHTTVAETCWIGPSAWCSSYANKCDPQSINILDHTVIRGVLRNEAGGLIKIGEHVYIGDDCILNSANKICIGNFTMLAHGVHVFDNDSHPLDWKERTDQNLAYRQGRAHAAPAVASGPIKIGQYVWIGFNAFIAKGVSIGDRSVVAACSVVTRDVPPDTLVGGNPAKYIRSLRSS